MIYQVHPDHGRHIAETPQEAEANKKNGWKTVTKEDFKAFGKNKSEAIERKKPGPKPKVDGNSA